MTNTDTFARPPEYGAANGSARHVTDGFGDPVVVMPPADGVYRIGGEALSWPEYCRRQGYTERHAQNAPAEARVLPSPPAGCSEHAWSEETLREPNFQVAYGAKRTCRRCGKVQFADFCAGRVGGPWVDVPNAAGEGAAKPYPPPAGCAPAYVCEQCGCGMSLLPPPEAIEEMKPRMLCPICLSGVQFDRHNAKVRGSE